MIRRLFIDVDAEEPALGAVHDEFPTVELLRGSRDLALPTVEVRAWAAASAGGAAFSAVIEDAAAMGALALRGGSPATVAATAWEVLTAFQRHVGRRNAASSGPCFERVLRAHAELFGSSRRVVAIERAHALDTWQWALRVRPFATMAAQIAALFHDVERIASESGRRVEPLAPDVVAYKDAHARVGAAMTRAVLHRVGVDPEIVDRACDIVEHHERGGSDEELRAVVDADALSFLSLGAAAWADELGSEAARRKIARTAARLGGRRRGVLARLPLRRDVRAMLDDALATPPSPSILTAEP